MLGGGNFGRGNGIIFGRDMGRFVCVLCLFCGILSSFLVIFFSLRWGSFWKVVCLWFVI